MNLDAPLGTSALGVWEIFYLNFGARLVGSTFWHVEPFFHAHVQWRTLGPARSGGGSGDRAFEDTKILRADLNSA